MFLISVEMVNFRLILISAVKFVLDGTFRSHGSYTYDVNIENDDTMQPIFSTETIRVGTCVQILFALDKILVLSMTGNS